MHPCKKPATLIALVALLLHLLLLTDLQAQQSPTDWPRWRGPDGAGQWQAPADLLLDWSIQEPTLVWDTPVGASYSGIAVSGDYVITMDRQKNDQTEADPLAGNEPVFCLNRKTGKLTWEFSYAAHYKNLDYNKGPRVTPTIHQGMVYTLGAVGHLSCLELKTGKMIWQRDLVAEEKAQVPTWGYSGSPLIINDTQLIIHAALQSNG